MQWNETGKLCIKCNKPVKKAVEIAHISDGGDFETYNYFWKCPCGYSNESSYSEC